MLYEKISAADKEKIQQYILYYAGDQDYLGQDNDFDAILREWDLQKSKYLFNLFGEQFILSKPINFSTPKEMIVNQMTDHLADKAFKDFNVEMREAFRKTNNASCIYDFNFLYSIHHLVSNKLCARVEFPTPSGKPLVFQEGTKVIKALGKLAAAYNVTSFEKFRLAHSRILNQKTTSGELCLSIHPLDYMTMSDNTYRWSSCMSWQSSGCYRAGTVEMMNSPCVVVAYLRGADDMNIVGSHTWNNKKWRNLFIVTPEFITSIKGYPYQNEELTVAAIEWIKELGAQWGEFEPVCKYNYKDPALPGRNFRFSFLNNGWMYNDFGTTEHYCALNKSFHVEEDNYVFCYGGRATCMCCGGTLHGHNEEYLYCSDCYHVETCACCGCELEEGDTWTIGDNVYCSSCYNEYAVEDPILEEAIHYDDSVSLYLLCDEDDAAAYRSYNNSICVSYNVWNAPAWRDYFNIAKPRRNDQWGNYYVYTSDCTALGRQLFNE